MNMLVNRRNENRDNGLNVIEAIVKYFVVLFACETILTQVAVASGFSFSSYTWLTLAVLPVACILARRTDAGATGNDPYAGDMPSGTTSAARSVCCTLSATCIAYWSGIPFVFCWWIVVATLAAAIVMRVDRQGAGTMPPSITKRSPYAVATVAVIAIVAAILTSVSHRPDADDAFFVSVPAYSLTHPDQPLLHADTMYADPINRLPLLMPVYAFDSIELLTAVIAKLLHLPAIVVAHVVLPPLLAVFVILIGALLVRQLRGGQLVGGALATLFFLIVLGEDHRTLGNFGFVRIHQGKAFLSCAIVPLLYYYAYRFKLAPTMSSWGLLTCAVVAAIGFSSTGIFLVPMILAIILIPDCRRLGWSTLAMAAAPIFYVALIAGAVYLRVSGHPYFQGAPDDTTADIIAIVFGARSQFLILFCITTAWFWVDQVSARRSLLWTAFLGFVGPLNPYLANFISHVITTPVVYWRVVWSVPSVAICAVVAVSMADLVIKSEKAWKQATIVGIALMVVVWLAQFNVAREANRVEFGVPHLKVPVADYRVAEISIGLTLPGKGIIAPDSVSMWIATDGLHPFIPVVRNGYLQNLREYISEKDFALRVSISALMAGQISDANQAKEVVDDSIKLFDAGLFVIPSAIGSSLKPMVSELVAQGFQLRREGDYQIWYLPVK